MVDRKEEPDYTGRTETLSPEEVNIVIILKSSGYACVDDCAAEEITDAEPLCLYGRFL